MHSIFNILHGIKRFQPTHSVRLFVNSVTHCIESTLDFWCTENWQCRHCHFINSRVLGIYWWPPLQNIYLIAIRTSLHAGKVLPCISLHNSLLHPSCSSSPSNTWTGRSGKPIKWFKTPNFWERMSPGSISANDVNVWLHSGSFVWAYWPHVLCAVTTCVWNSVTTSSPNFDNWTIFFALLTNKEHTLTQDVIVSDLQVHQQLSLRAFS